MKHAGAEDNQNQSRYGQDLPVSKLPTPRIPHMEATIELGSTGERTPIESKANRAEASRLITRKAGVKRSRGSRSKGTTDTPGARPNKKSRK